MSAAATPNSIMDAINGRGETAAAFLNFVPDMHGPRFNHPDRQPALSLLLK